MKDTKSQKCNLSMECSQEYIKLIIQVWFRNLMADITTEEVKKKKEKKEKVKIGSFSAAKTSPNVYFLRICIQSDQQCKERCYNNFVRIRLEHPVVYWTPHLKKDKWVLANVQRRTARFITTDYLKHDCSNIFKDLHIHSFYQTQSGLEIAVRSTGTLENESYN